MIEDQTQLIEIFRNEYNCPLSGKVMKTPVMDSQGYSYQYQDIQKYFNINNSSICVSPLTGKQFSSKELIENIYLQNLIQKVQTQIPKIYSYIKLLKNQITHLKLQNQKLISQNQLNYEDSHTQSQIINTNLQKTLNITNSLNHGKSNHQQIQNHQKNQTQQYSKVQHKLSKRKVIKKIKFQKFYDNSMAKLLKQEKIQSEEYKNRQRISNQRKFKKYQKIKHQNNQTIKNLIYRINVQQKLIKKIKQQKAKQTLQIQNIKQTLQIQNIKQTRQQILVPRNDIFNKQIQTDQFSLVTDEIEKTRQNQIKLQEKIKKLEKQRDDLRHQIQKIQVHYKYLDTSNQLFQQQIKNQRYKFFKLTQQNEFVYEQIQKQSKQNLILQKKMQENKLLYEKIIIQQKFKSDLLQQKLNSRNQKDQELIDLRNQLQNQIQQNSKINKENQKIRDDYKKQIKLFQQKNSSLAQSIKQNTQLWTLFMIILQDSLSGFKQLNKNSKQLNKNSKQLNKNSKQLNKNSKQLNKNSKQLNKNIETKPIQIKQINNPEDFSMFKKNKKEKEIIQIIDESEQQVPNQLSIQKGKQDLKIQQMQQEKPVENQPLPISNTLTVNQQNNQLNGQVSNSMVAKNIIQNQNTFDSWISETIQNLQSIISKRINGFLKLQVTKLKQLKNIFRKLKFLNQVCSHTQEQQTLPNPYVLGKIFNSRDQIPYVGYDFQLINFLKRFSDNQYVDLCWNETIFIKSTQTQMTDILWQILVKNLNLYNKIIQINLTNNKIQNINKKDLQKLKYLKQINLTNCRLNQKSIKELTQFKQQNPHIQVIY